MSLQGSCFKYGLSEKLLFHCSNFNKYIASFNSSKARNSKLSSAYLKLISSLFLDLISINQSCWSKQILWYIGVTTSSYSIMLQ